MEGRAVGGAWRPPEPKEAGTPNCASGRAEGGDREGGVRTPSPPFPWVLISETVVLPSTLPS